MGFFAIVLSSSFIGQRYVTLWSEVDEVFWRPMLLGRMLHIHPGSAGLLAILLVVWRVALGLAAIGLFTSFSTRIAALLGVYLLALPHTFSKVDHGDTMVALGLLLFAIVPSGGGWSFDSLIRRARHPEPMRAGSDTDRLTAGAGWHVQLFKMLLPLAFFSAGIAKLRVSGLWAWASADNLRYQALRHFYTHRPPTQIAQWIASYPILTQSLAINTLVIELGAPLLVVLRGFWLLAALGAVAGMQIGFWLILGVFFFHLLLLILFFFLPWRSIAALLRARWPAVPMDVLFDGSCGICQQTMSVLRGLDVFGRLRRRDVLADWRGISVDHPALSQDRCLDTMHVIASDGVYTGFEAYRRMARVLPLIWLVLPLLYLPPVPWFGRRIYARVAHSRLLNGCPIPERSGVGPIA